MQILLLHIDRNVRAQSQTQIKPRPVPGLAYDDDPQRTRHFGREHAAQALLSGPEDQHRFARTRAAIQHRPLKSIAEGNGERRNACIQALRKLVNDAVQRHVEILREPAPQMRKHGAL